MAQTPRPWPLAAGVATAVAGVTLIILAGVGAGPPPAVSAAALVIAALIELGTGALLTRRGGSGMAHVFGGALAVGLALFVFGRMAADPGGMSPAPVALGIGLYCLLNAVFRGIDVVIDRPQAALAESVDCAFTFVVGAVLLGHWRGASESFIAVATGIELVAGGMALFASVFARERHPELPAYQGRTDRFVREPH